MSSLILQAETILGKIGSNDEPSAEHLKDIRQIVEAQQAVLKGILDVLDVMPMEGPLSILKDHLQTLPDQNTANMKSFLAFIEDHGTEIPPIDFGPGT